MFLAPAIIGGALVTETERLSGHYMELGEGTDDVSGYLPQMIRDVAADIGKRLGAGRVGDQARSAVAFLRRELTARYEAQQASK